MCVPCRITVIRGIPIPIPYGAMERTLDAAADAEGDSLVLLDEY